MASDAYHVEARLASKGEGRFSWLFGAAYYESDKSTNDVTYQAGAAAFIDANPANFGGNPGSLLAPDDNFSRYIASQTNKDLGIFGEVSFDITSTLTATVGGRYYDLSSDATVTRPPSALFLDSFDAVGSEFSEDQSEDGFTPKASLSYSPNDNFMVYGLYSQGFRVGGASPNPPGLVGVPPSYDSDTVDNYELGIRSSLADNSVQLDVTAFHIDWSNMQVRLFTPAPFYYSYVSNAGAADVDGVELALGWRAPSIFDLQASVTWEDARVSTFVEDTFAPGGGHPAGTTLPGSSEWVTSVTAGFNFDSVPWAPRLEISDRYMSDAPVAWESINERGGFSIVDMRLSAQPTEKMSVSLFLNNVLDEYGTLNAPFADFYVVPLGTVTRPRTYGLRLTYDFRLKSRTDPALRGHGLIPCPRRPACRRGSALIRKSGAAIVCVLALVAGSSNAADPAPEISAFGRRIDLEGYLGLAPAESLYVDQRSHAVYFASASGNAKVLARLSLPTSPSSGPAEISAAQPLSTVDLSKRNFWGASYSTLLGRTIIRTDEAGEERINLYTVEPDGKFSRITDVGYIYGWDLSPDGVSSRMRAGKASSIRRVASAWSTCRHVRERVLYQDSKALRPFWSKPAWRADGKAFLLTMVVDEDRSLQNIALISTTGRDAGRPRLMTDSRIRRELVLPENPWVDTHRFIYISTESGSDELYLHDVDDGDQRVVAFQAGKPVEELAAGHLAEAAVVHAGGRHFAVTVVKSAQLDVIRVLELPSGRVAFERSLPEDVSCIGRRIDCHPADFVPNAAGQAVRAWPAPGGFGLRAIAEYGRATEDLVQCTVEKVSYRTFDGLSAPGESGTLHAWLYRPKKPLPPEKSMLVVEAFTADQRPFIPFTSCRCRSFCAAGVYFLSPPRGSWTMGNAFRLLIRGDLGGAEILDVGAAAKWGQDALGIPPARTGAFGLSHGGYATMRLLTLPDTVNGTPVDFHFGFGISDAGISNLMRHAGNSNIRGWSVDLMGEDPDKDPG